MTTPPLHVRDIALLKTLDEDSAVRWTIAAIDALFSTTATFEASLQRLQELVRQIRQTAGPRARDAARDPKAQGGGEP